jgi:hypothetical protein
MLALGCWLKGVVAAQPELDALSDRDCDWEMDGDWDREREPECEGEADWDRERDRDPDKEGDCDCERERESEGEADWDADHERECDTDSERDWLGDWLVDLLIDGLAEALCDRLCDWEELGMSDLLWLVLCDSLLVDSGSASGKGVSAQGSTTNSRPPRDTNEGNGAIPPPWAMTLPHPETVSESTPMNPALVARLPSWKDASPYIGLFSYKPSSKVKVRSGGENMSSTWKAARSMMPPPIALYDANDSLRTEPMPLGDVRLLDTKSSSPTTRRTIGKVRWSAAESRKPTMQTKSPRGTNCSLVVFWT